jgi:hypothetical protein
MSEPVQTDTILGNYVVLQTGIPKRLKLVDHRIYPKDQKDSVSGRIKTVNTLQFDVVEEDGAKVNTVYEVQGEKHARQFAAFLDGKTYIGKTVTITSHGKGFLREYTVTWE